MGIMSLFGKILAFLNVLGVFGVLALGLMTYTKKVQWQSACAFQELMITGLPLDRNQIDAEGFPSFDDLSPTLVKQLPGLQGSSLLTQIDAVEAAHGTVVDKTTQGDTVQQIAALAPAAVPFTSDAGRYTDLLLIRRWLPPDADGLRAGLANIKAALAKAHADAEAVVKDMAPMPDRPKRTYAEAFREAADTQGGMPKVPFVREYLRAQAAEPTLAFDALFGKMLERIKQGLTDDLDYPYKAAKTGVLTYREWTPPAQNQPESWVEKSTSKPSGPAFQKYLIVRYLYNVLPTTATTEERTPAQGDWAAPAVKKIISIVGLEAFPAALHEQASRLGKLQASLRVESGVAHTIASELARQVERDRLEFTAQHAKILEYLRTQAALVADRAERYVRAKGAADKQALLLASAQALNAGLQKSLDDLRGETLQVLGEVRAYTKDFHAIQQKTRDAAEMLQRLEGEIRRRERLAQ